jgi:uronate dehydrogenase
MNQRERILITGPAGRVGTHLVPLLRDHFALRLFELKEIPAVGDDEVIRGDIRDLDALTEACRGVRAMIHLAAVPDEDDFESKLLPMNLQGGYNAFEAACRSKVPRMIFTSTAQTVLNYKKGEWVTPDMPARPFTVYACTKMFGEALARYYVDRRGMSILCIRLAWFQNYDSRELHTRRDMAQEWCSPRDLTQLLVKAIQADLDFGIFFGVSNNTGRYWDISNGERLLGYAPEDNAADYFR